LALDRDTFAAVDASLAQADAQLDRLYPGASGTRQPVHTVYVSADRFDVSTPETWGSAALELMHLHLPSTAAMAELLALSAPLAHEVYPRVVAKLQHQPIEDLRIDFEDGYGHRSDAEEDAHARAAANAVLFAIDDARAPTLVGIRFKSLERSTRVRGLRTFDLFLSTLLAGGELPDGLILTLPKVTSVDQVLAFADVCSAWEQASGLPDGRLKFEIQIETPQAIIGADGTAPVARMVHAAPTRLTGLHYGTYDFSAACGITAEHQSLAHPIADHAKAVMMLAVAGTDVRLSDGSTNVLPVGDRESVRSAWKLHADLVRRSLERGFYQGWDLHPGQLVTRFAATFAFYREAFPAASVRLGRFYLGQTGPVADEPATARALTAVLTRAVHAGAVDTAEIVRIAGLDWAIIEGSPWRQAQ